MAATNPRISLDRSILLNIEPNNAPVRRKGVWRYWRGLSSLQRRLLLTALFCAAFVAWTLSGFPTFGKSSDIAVGHGHDHEIPNIQQIEAEAAKAEANAKEIDKAEQRVVEADTKDDAKKQAAGGADAQQKSKKKALAGRFARTDLRFQGPQSDRQRAVVNAALHSWKAYRAHAWGYDELQPVSKTGQNWFDLGLTIVDSLDTLYMMGLLGEFTDALKWVDGSLGYDTGRVEVNVFEVTIRILGGLLSAYSLTGEAMFLRKATDLGERLSAAFKTESGIPYSDLNLKTLEAHAPRWLNGDVSTSEVSTLYLEFQSLSRATGDSRFEALVDRVATHLHGLDKRNGLVPIYITVHNGRFRPQSTITLGARADSYYEYLLKYWIQTGKSRDYLREDYESAVNGIRSELARDSSPNKLKFVGEIDNGRFSAKMDELACFFPGTLALGVMHGMPAWHGELAEALAFTCWQMYKRTPTGLAPEIAYFNMMPGLNRDDIEIRPNDAHNLQRPETIESLWYLHRLTRKQQYADWAWAIFQSFEKYTKVDAGYSSIGNVNSPANVGYKNKMESFWLAETLKYFYLIFTDEHELKSANATKKTLGDSPYQHRFDDFSMFPLDKWVFNTEAHPLPIYSFNAEA